MIKNNNFRFVGIDRSITTNQLFFNTVVFSLPLFIICWVSGLWVCFVCILLLYNIRFNKNSYLGAVKEYYKIGRYRYVLASFVCYLFFSINSIVFLNSPLKSIDNAIVFLIWLAISPVISLLKPSSCALGYGCLCAVVISVFIAIIQFHYFKIDRPYGMYGAGFPGSGAIKFGDISLLLGVLAYILLSEKKLQFLSMLSVGLGFIACLYAGARGGMFAAFLCTVIWIFIKTKKISIKNTLMSIFLIGFFFIILNSVTENHILSRVTATINELSYINENKYNTSMGARLQMWQAALIIFWNSPILGVGLNNFDDALLILYKEHIISNSIIKFSHAHNEYFCSLATGGIVGFIITISLFFVPTDFFKEYYYQNVWAKAGFWSICLIAFFGLTDCVFDRRMTIMAFAVLTSVCMAGHISQIQLKTVNKSQ